MKASIEFTEEDLDTIRLEILSGTAEHKGEKITLAASTALGLSITYKEKLYYLSPSNLIAGVIDAVNGTVNGE